MRRLVVLLAMIALLDVADAKATPFIAAGQECVNPNHDEETLVASTARGVRLFTTERAWIADIRSVESAAIDRAFHRDSFFFRLLGVEPHNLSYGRPLDLVVISPAGVDYQASTMGLCGERDPGFAGIALTHQDSADFRDLTVLHELFHVLQRTVNPEHASAWWWGEASAEWVSWKATRREPAEVRNTAAYQFLLHPAFPLDRYRYATDGLDEDHAYAAALFVDWLSIRYPADRFKRFLRASLARPKGTATVSRAVHALTRRSLGDNLAEFWSGAVWRRRTPVPMTRAGIAAEGTNLARAVEPLAADIVDLAPSASGFHLRVPPTVAERAGLEAWIAYGPEENPTLRRVDPAGENLYFCPPGSDAPESEPIPPYLRLIVVNGNLTGGARSLNGAEAQPDDCQADPAEPRNCPQNIDLAVRDGMTNGRYVESVDLNNDGEITDDERIERNRYREPVVGPLCYRPRPGAQVCSRVSRLPRSLTLDSGARLAGVRFGMTKRQVCQRWGRPAVQIGDAWHWGQAVPNPSELEPYLRAKTKSAYIVSYCRYGPSLLPPEQRAGLRPLPCREADRLAAFGSSGALGHMLEMDPPLQADWVEAQFLNGKLWSITSWRARDQMRSGLHPGSDVSEVSARLGRNACRPSLEATYCTARRGPASARCEIWLTTRPVLYGPPVHPRPPNLGTRVRTLSIRGVGSRACAPRD